MTCCGVTCAPLLRTQHRTAQLSAAQQAGAADLAGRVLRLRRLPERVGVWQQRRAARHVAGRRLVDHAEAVAAHLDVRQRRVHHQVHVAHLVLVRRPRGDGDRLVARVKVARDGQVVAWPQHARLDGVEALRLLRVAHGHDLAVAWRLAGGARGRKRRGAAGAAAVSGTGWLQPGAGAAVTRSSGMQQSMAACCCWRCRAPGCEGRRVMNTARPMVCVCTRTANVVSGWKPR